MNFKKVFASLLTAAMLVGCGASTGGTAGTTTEGGDSEGKVYFLNFKPELDETLQGLAKTYTEKTGVDVKVVTAASGTYSQTLTAEMDKSTKPTLVIIGNQAGVKEWSDYAIDLTGTEIANELNTDAYNLYDESGKLVLNAVTYAGNTAGAAKAELVVIGGTGTYEDGHVTLSDDAEGYFFKLKKTLSNGTAYYVVTPVVLKADNVEAEPIPETTAEKTTEAITYEQTAVEYPTDTEPAAEKGCGGMISLSVLALIPAAVLIIKKKED